MMIDQNKETDKYVKKLDDYKSHERLMTELKSYVDSRMISSQQKELNIWIKIFGSFLPFVIAYFVWVSNISSNQVLMKYQIQANRDQMTLISNEIKVPLNTLAVDFTEMKIEISRIKEKLNISDRE